MSFLGFAESFETAWIGATLSVLGSFSWCQLVEQLVGLTAQPQQLIFKLATTINKEPMSEQHQHLTDRPPLTDLFLSSLSAVFLKPDRTKSHALGPTPT